MALAAVIGGVGCALGVRHWWHTYRHDPAAHTHGATPRVLGMLAAGACVGFALLLVVS